MKSISYSLIAAAAAVGFAYGADTATTKPVGYVTNSLQVGFNLVGLTLVSATTVTGDIETVNGAQIGDTDINLQTTLPAGKTYILEITSGAAQGTVQEFTTVSGGTITLPAALTGVAADDKYRIRVAPTLEEIFGTTLQHQSTATGSDVVWLPNGPGVFDRYYLFKPLIGTPSWRKLNSNGTETAAPNTPLIYLDGLFVEVKTAPKNLVLAGEVRGEATSVFLGQGFNAVGTVFPVGSTLASSNLAASLQGQGTIAGSDIVWVATGAGVYTKYYFHKTVIGAGAWRRINPDNTADVVDPASVELSSGVFIERKGAAKSVLVGAPNYSL